MWRPGQPRRSPTKNLVPMVRTWPHKLHETASQPHPFPNTAQRFEQTTRLAAIYQPPLLPRLKKKERRAEDPHACAGETSDTLDIRQKTGGKLAGQEAGRRDK